MLRVKIGGKLKLKMIYLNVRPLWKRSWVFLEFSNGILSRYIRQYFKYIEVSILSLYRKWILRKLKLKLIDRNNHFLWKLNNSSMNFPMKFCHNLLHNISWFKNRYFSLYIVWVARKVDVENNRTKKSSSTLKHKQFFNELLNEILSRSIRRCLKSIAIFKLITIVSCKIFFISLQSFKPKDHAQKLITPYLKYTGASFSSSRCEWNIKEKIMKLANLVNHHVL